MTLKQPLTASLLAVLALSATGKTYPDLPVALADGGGALIGDTAYVGLGSAEGGLFALYHLYTRGTMRGYYLSSPSIWWESRRIDAFADRYHAPANRLTIRISAGSGEQAAPGDEKRRRRAMVENARALAAQLQQSQSDTTFTLLEGENHGSAAFAALKTLLQTPGDSAP